MANGNQVLSGAAVGIGGALTGNPLAIASGIGSAVGGLFNNDQSKAYELWEKQQEYNSPKNQRKRMEEAGFNPYMMVGNGGINAGNATSAPQQTGVTDVNRSVDNMSSMLNAFANQSSVLSQVALNKSQEDLNKSTAALNAAKTQTEGTTQQLNIASADRSTAETALLKLRSINQDLENNLLSEYGGKQKAAEIENIVSNTLKTNEDAKLVSKNIDVAASQILKNYAEIHNLNVNSAQVIALLPYVKANMAARTAGMLLENQLTVNEVNWQNDTSSTGSGRTNYQTMKALEMQGLNKDVYGKGLQNDSQSQQNSSFWIDKMLNAVTSLGNLGLGGVNAIQRFQQIGNTRDFNNILRRNQGDMTNFRFEEGKGWIPTTQSRRGSHHR